MLMTAASNDSQTLLADPDTRPKLAELQSCSKRCRRPLSRRNLNKIKDNFNPTRNRELTGPADKSVRDYTGATNEYTEQQPDSKHCYQIDAAQGSSSCEHLSRNRPTICAEHDVTGANRKSYVNFIASKLEYTKSSDDVSRYTVAAASKPQADASLAKSQTLDCIDLELSKRCCLTL